jgi:hypothetical protein
MQPRISRPEVVRPRHVWTIPNNLLNFLRDLPIDELGELVNLDGGRDNV